MDYIENYIIYQDYGCSYFEKLPEVDDEKIPVEIRDAMLFLNENCNFIYADNLFQENPFKQLYKFVNGLESKKIEDIKAEDESKFLDVIKLTKNKFLIAKIYDILGIVCNSKEYKNHASKYYYKSFKEIVVNNNSNIQISLSRAIYLSTKKDKKEIISDIFTKLQFNNNDAKYNAIYYIVLVLERTDKLILYSNISYIEEAVYNAPIKSQIITLDILESIIGCYVSRKDKENQKKWMNYYIDICQQLNNSFSPHGYEYLNKAIDLIKKSTLRQEYDELMDDLLFKREDEYKKCYESLDFHELPIDNEVVNSYRKMVDIYKEKYDKKPNAISKFILVLTEFRPITLEVIQQQIKTNNNGLSKCFNNIRFDEKCNIIFESVNATEEDENEYNISNIIMNDLEIKSELLFYMLYNFSLDNEFIELLKEIIGNNLFVPKDRVDIVCSSILKGLSKNIREAVYDLISQFENGCCYYLINKKIYPHKYSGSNIYDADLNHILVKKGNNKNRYRDEISKVTGDDLMLSLEYLLCRRLCGNLRNNSYHRGCANKDEINIYEIGAFLYLLKVFCLGYE